MMTEFTYYTLLDIIKIKKCGREWNQDNQETDQSGSLFYVDFTRKYYQWVFQQICTLSWHASCNFSAFPCLRLLMSQRAPWPCRAAHILGAGKDAKGRGERECKQTCGRRETDVKSERVKTDRIAQEELQTQRWSVKGKGKKKRGEGGQDWNMRGEMNDREGSEERSGGDYSLVLMPCPFFFFF